MDTFKNKIMERAGNTKQKTTEKDLAHQNMGRPLTQAEFNLAKNIMEIFSENMHDFNEVVKQLNIKEIPTLNSGKTEWSLTLLQEELSSLNKTLDKAYHENGFGA